VGIFKENGKESMQMTEEIKADVTVDARGLSCPMPLLKAKKALKDMKTGQVLEILGTDPGSKNDMPAFCKKAGHEYLPEIEDEGFTRFFIKLK
jgi:tRNA 2-thiouridine synthesizing protein A